jgi:two-component system sensor histidine kinase UhpB
MASAVKLPAVKSPVGSILRPLFLLLLITSGLTGNVECSGQSRDELRHSLKIAANNKEVSDALFQLGKYHMQQLKFDSIRFYSDRLKTQSEKEHYPLALGKARILDAAMLQVRRKFTEAWAEYQDALSIFQNGGDQRYLAICYQNMGRCRGIAMELDESIYYFRKSILTFEGIGDTSDIYNPYLGISVAYIQRFEIDSAIYYMNKALAIAERQDNGKKLAMCYYNLTYYYMSMGDYKTSLQYAVKAVDHKDGFTSTVDYRNAVQNLINCNIETERYTEAEAQLILLEDLNAQLKDEWGKAASALYRGSIALRTEHPAEALRLLRGAESAMDTASQADKKMLKANISSELGKCYSLLGNIDSSKYYAKKLLAIATDIDNRLLKMNGHDMLSGIFYLDSKYDSSILHYRAYAALKDSFLNMNRQSLMLTLKEQYEAEKKEQQISVLTAEKQRDNVLLQLRIQEIDREKLIGRQKNQQLTLITKENQINQLEAGRRLLDLEYQKKETEKKQGELMLLTRQDELKKLKLEAGRQRELFAAAAVLAILAFGSFWFYRYRRQKTLENTQAVLKERLRISRDLHDDMGATLSSISVYSSAVKQRLDDKRIGEAYTMLDTISEGAQDMVGNISDMVWMINPQNDTMEKLFDRMQLFASNVLSAKNILFDFKVDEDLRAAGMSMDTRKNLFLLFKEAVNNAAKYSGALRIQGRLEQSGNKLQMTIRDDGKGFDLQSKVDGNGLRNMRQRAKDLNGDIQIESAPGKGTVISFAMFSPKMGSKTTLN